MTQVTRTEHDFTVIFLVSNVVVIL